MSDIYSDPVGDRLRTHDLRMREVRWVNAKEVLITLCICLAIIGVTWAIAFTIVRNKPRFATGVDATGKPWCETFDERPCPVYVPGFTTLPTESRR